MTTVAIALNQQEVSKQQICTQFDTQPCSQSFGWQYLNFNELQRLTPKSTRLKIMMWHVLPGPKLVRWRLPINDMVVRGATFFRGSKVSYHEKQVNPIFHRRYVYLCGGSIDALVDTVVGCICNLPWHRIPFEPRKQRDRDVSPGVRLPESLGKNWVTLQPQYWHAFRTTVFVDVCVTMMLMMLLH